MTVDKSTTLDMIKRTTNNEIHTSHVLLPKNADLIYEDIMSADSIERSLYIAKEYKEAIESAISILEGFKKAGMHYSSSEVAKEN